MENKFYRGKFPELFRVKDPPLEVVAFSLPADLNEKITKVAAEIGIRQRSRVMRVIFDLGWAAFAKRRGIK